MCEEDNQRIVVERIHPKYDHHCPLLPGRDERDKNILLASCIRKQNTDGIDSCSGGCYSDKKASENRIKKKALVREQATTGRGNLSKIRPLVVDMIKSGSSKPIIMRTLSLNRHQVDKHTYNARQKGELPTVKKKLNSS